MWEATAICTRRLHVDLWPSGVQVTCDVGYLCTNFSLPRPLCSRLRLDVHDRQTDVRHSSSLNASALWGRGHNNRVIYSFACVSWFMPIPPINDSLSPSPPHPHKSCRCCHDHRHWGSAYSSQHSHLHNQVDAILSNPVHVSTLCWDWGFGTRTSTTPIFVTWGTEIDRTEK